MALKLDAQEKQYDNMLRQLNSQLVKAYKHLGENSQEYKNLAVLGTSIGLQGHMNKDGVFQYDRNRKQISNMTQSQLGAIKEQYYAHDKNGKIKQDKMKQNMLNKLYNVQNKVNTIKNDAKKYFNTKTPTLNQMRYMSEKDMLVSQFWTNYNEYQDAYDGDDDSETGIKYHAYQDIANQIYGGYDITNKPQTDDDFDRLHNLVTQGLAVDGQDYIVNSNGFAVDLRTGEVLASIDPRTQAIFDEDYFAGEDWTTILQ